MAHPGTTPQAISGVRDGPLVAGQTYAVWFPFGLDKWTPLPEPVIPGDYEGRYTDPPEQDTWVPGWTTEVVANGPEDVEAVPDWAGNGQMLLTIVSLHKPGPTYPERAFYIRQWRDPDGKVFGRRNLRCISSRTLKEWLRGSKTAHLAEFHADLVRSAEALFREALASHLRAPLNASLKSREDQ